MSLVFRPRDIDILASGTIVTVSGVVTTISGSGVRVSGETVATRNEEMNTVILSDILAELKKLNIHLSMITDNEIKSSDVE
jgi:hypothetical protein